MGNKKTDHRQRQKHRDKLRQKGVPEPEIRVILIAMADEQRRKRHGLGRHWDYEPPDPPAPLVDVDDTGYRPAAPDKLLTGAARVTGLTAKAVRRTKAMTLHEHRQAVTEQEAAS